VTPPPEEPPEEGPERDESSQFSYGSDPGTRGWIDPDDRLWRHPSEMAVRSVGRVDTRPIGARHPKTVVLIGAAATLAAVAWATVLLSPPSNNRPTSLAADKTADPTLTTSALKVDAVPPAATSAGHSMVQLRAETNHGVVTVVGVAVAEGGLVATTADGLSGLHSIAMIGANGRKLRARVLAIDAASDLALVSVPVDVPVAPFADDASLDAGSADMTLSMASPDHGTVTVKCLDGSVTAVGTEIASGWAKGMPAIISSVPAAHQEAGDPLLNPEGSVVGLLYGTGATSTFLPTQLVLGVADDLRSTGKVDHGWLGVQGTTASTSGGAKVAALMNGSPAHGLLAPGDVVMAVNSMPIRSMADLRARLYVLPPHSTVGLAVDNGSTTQVVDVTLSASP
jgi:S1-C subfamily serine protease